jgi:MFS family permease
MEDVTSSSIAREQLNSAITLIGPGPYQLIVLCLGGGVYTAEGSLLLMLSVIAKSLIIRWKLSALFAGAMVSIIFAGLLVGTILGGFLCDRYGRRMPILVTYFGMTTFLFASLLSPDVLLLITAKFMLGVSLGFGVPAANAIVCESCPSSHRSNVYSMTMVLFSLGQMYSACVLWVMSPQIDHLELQWRWMLMLAAMLPAILGVLSYFFLLESSHWLIAQGRFSEAQAVVVAIAQYKSLSPELIEDLTDSMVSPALAPAESPPIEDTVEHSSSDRDIRAKWWLNIRGFLGAFVEDFERVKQLFSEKFLRTTLLMSFISFVSNFAYYGMVYGLPDTLKKESESGPSNLWSPAAGVFLSAVFEIPGVFIAILLGTTVGRRLNMTISFGLTALALFGLIYVMHRGELDNVGLAAVFGVKLCIASVFIVVYLYLLECYPTKCRATGLAFSMVIGRMGAFGCPFLFDGLELLHFDYLWFFGVMGFLVSLAGVASFALPYETKDSQLMEDDVPANEPLLDVESSRSPVMAERKRRPSLTNESYGSLERAAHFKPTPRRMLSAPTKNPTSP